MFSKTMHLVKTVLSTSAYCSECSWSPRPAPVSIVWCATIITLEFILPIQQKHSSCRRTSLWRSKVKTKRWSTVMLFGAYCSRQATHKGMLACTKKNCKQTCNTTKVGPFQTSFVGLQNSCIVFSTDKPCRGTSLTQMLGSTLTLVYSVEQSRR